MWEADLQLLCSDFCGACSVVCIPISGSVGADVSGVLVCAGCVVTASVVAFSVVSGAATTCMLTTANR